MVYMQLYDAMIIFFIEPPPLPPRVQVRSRVDQNDDEGMCDVTLINMAGIDVIFCRISMCSLYQ